MSWLIRYSHILYLNSLRLSLIGMDAVTELFSSNSLSSRVAAEVRGQAARRGLTQADVGRVLGLSQPQISGRLRGKMPFRLDEIDTLARHFGVDATELMPKCAVRDLNPEPAGLVQDRPENDFLATVLPFAPQPGRRLTTLRPTLPHRVFRRDTDRSFSRILLHCGVST